MQTPDDHDQMNWHTVLMLIALAGLPGTGKTSIARTLAPEFGAVHLRIDAIETVLHREGMWSDEHPAVAYEIAAELAADQLGHGLPVIIDAVNPVQEARALWRELASRHHTALVAVELVCADAAEHRRRVEHRTPDLRGQVVPSWHEVVDRQYVAWDDADVLHVDTAATEHPASAIAAHVRDLTGAAR